MFRILKHNLFDTVVGATVVIDVEVVDVDPHLKRPHQSRRTVSTRTAGFVIVWIVVTRVFRLNT